MVINKKVYFFLFLILSLESCFPPIKPTYTRLHLKEEIKQICKEFSLDNVKVKEAGQTLYIYAPFTNLLHVTAEEIRFNKEILDKSRYLFLALSRVTLSMDNPPQFYVIIMANIKNVGLISMQIGYLEDLRKFYLNYISNQELFDRIISLNYVDYQILDDTEGKNIKYIDIQFEDFLSLLMSQKIWYYLSTELKKFKISGLEVNLIDDTFSINIYSSEKRLPEEFISKLLKLFKFYLNIYEFQKYVGAEISLNEHIIKFYSKTSLDQMKIPSRLSEIFRS